MGLRVTLKAFKKHLLGVSFAFSIQFMHFSGGLQSFCLRSVFSVVSMVNNLEVVQHLL